MGPCSKRMTSASSARLFSSVCTLPSLYQKQRSAAFVRARLSLWRYRHQQHSNSPWCVYSLLLCSLWVSAQCPVVPVVTAARVLIVGSDTDSSERTTGSNTCYVMGQHVPIQIISAAPAPFLNGATGPSSHGSLPLPATHLPATATGTVSCTPLTSSPVHCLHHPLGSCRRTQCTAPRRPSRASCCCCWCCWSPAPAAAGHPGRSSAC
jgi:hypothetical protein